MIHNIPLLCRMGFNKYTEHLGMSDMKTMMKYLTAASFIVVAPFVNADDHSGTEMQTAKESQVQMTKKARHSANGLPVKQLLLRAQTSQASQVNHFDANVEARTLHLPALTQLR